MAVPRSRLLPAFALSALSTVLLITGCQGVANSAAPQAAVASAFVYVLSNPNGNNFAINVFSTDSTGQLTPVPGSPFAANVSAIAANRNYLFGTDGTNIYSFSIAANGALTQVSSINAMQSIPVAGVVSLSIDGTGTTLYAHLINDSNDDYESFSVDHSTGVLTYLGATSTGLGASPLSFAGNSVYGFSTSCFHGFTQILSFKRNNDGTLAEVFDGLTDSPDPARLCPGAVAAGPTSNLAVAFVPGGAPGGPPQDNGAVLAVYTVDSSGFLTTSSTVANMPQTAVGGMIEMSPSGKFLAAGGLGLQMFHFNGSDPITPFTGLLTNDQIDQMVWDNDNNLYAISQSASKLSVFTVTATSAGPAPGSSYAITNPRGIAIARRD
jgi:hypothetical protein